MVSNLVRLGHLGHDQMRGDFPQAKMPRGVWFLGHLGQHKQHDLNDLKRRRWGQKARGAFGSFLGLDDLNDY
jgi:hypothetical protein